MNFILFHSDISFFNARRIITPEILQNILMNSYRQFIAPTKFQASKVGKILNNNGGWERAKRVPVPPEANNVER